MNFVDIFAGLILGLGPANERCYNVSHWLGANLESALYLVMSMLCVYTHLYYPVVEMHCYHTCPIVSRGYG